MNDIETVRIGPHHHNYGPDEMRHPCHDCEHDAALSRIEARIAELEAALREAVNTLGPDHFAGELVGLIAEGNEALRVLRAALEGKDR